MDAAPPVQQRGSFSTILLLCLIFYLSSRSDLDPFLQGRLHDRIEAARYTYGNYSAWMNGTQSNFTEEWPPAGLDTFEKTLLPSPGYIDAQRFSYWSNITGFWKGPMKLYNLSDVANLPSSWHSVTSDLLKDVNMTEVPRHTDKWGWSKVEKGSFRISDMASRDMADVQTVTGHLDMESDSGYSKFQFDGLHLPSAGALYGLMSPNGFPPDIRKLPTLVPPEWHNTSVHVVQQELKEQLEKLEKQFDTGFGESESSSPDNTDTTCDFYFFAHLAPNNVSGVDLAELEQEMKHPTGISTVGRQPAVLDVIFISPKCALLCEMRNADGLRVDQFWRKVTIYAGLASVGYLALLLLLVQQMEATRTPAAISGVARWTINLQVVMDSFSATSHAMFGILTKNKASLSMIAPGFLACILSLMFEVRFTSLIYRIQGPEDEREATTATTTTPSAATATPSSAPGQNTTPGAEATPPANNDGARRLRNALANPDTRSYIFMLIIVVLILQANFSPSTWVIVGAILYSFWIPQIVRNVKQNNRKALSKRYVIGTSFLRSLLILYVFACPNNILLVEQNNLVFALVGWLAFQVLVLIGQEYLGAGFFVPKGWIQVPDKFDYHPNLLSDPEAPEQNLGDCAICMEPIVIRPDGGSGEKGEVGTGASLLLSAGMRRSYAMTPCSHIMHTACLEKWMRVKSVCPTCRSPLPPL